MLSQEIEGTYHEEAGDQALGSRSSREIAIVIACASHDRGSARNGHEECATTSSAIFYQTNWDPRW